MKKTLIYLTLFILVFSCAKNDFIQTKRLLKTDKEVYLVDDTFELTILVYPEKGDKTIRFFKDYSNINISFSLKKEPDSFHQELRKRFVEGPSLFRNDGDFIDKYNITNNEPFEKKLKGYISEQKGKIIFNIPKLNLSDSIDISLINQKPIIKIDGYCETVNTSYQEYFIPKDIKINLKS